MSADVDAALGSLIAGGFVTEDDRDRYRDMARAMVTVVLHHDGGAADILVILARSGIQIRRGPGTAEAAHNVVLAIRGGP